MEIKTLFHSEKEFYKSFVKQFNDTENAEFAWKIVDKPKDYPCVVVKSCGKYIHVYPNDFGNIIKKADN